MVGADFSPCSRLAFRKACEMIAGNPGRIIALHVIDSNFIQTCINHSIGSEDALKKQMFIRAKGNLDEFIDAETSIALTVTPIVCEGIPYVEINKMAREYEADMIVLGSCGKSDDLDAIFFGSTTEKVLRFISRPVLCVPPDTQGCAGL